VRNVVRVITKKPAYMMTGMVCFIAANVIMKLNDIRRFGDD
jgi:hypothetical protein